MYSPAPSPYGNTANLSHTSTTMLVPMHSQAPHSVILGPAGPQMGTELTHSHFPHIQFADKIHDVHFAFFSRSFFRHPRLWHAAKIRWLGRPRTADLPHRLHYRSHMQPPGTDDNFDGCHRRKCSEHSQSPVDVDGWHDTAQP